MKLNKLSYFAIAAMLLLAGTAADAQTSAETLRKNPDELYAYACGLYKRGFHDMALAEYDLFLKENPESKNAPDAEIFRIYCLDKLGRQQEMLDSIRSFKKKHSKNKYADELGVKAAEYLISSGRRDAALEFLQPLSSSGNKIIGEYAQFQIAQHHAATGAVQEAMQIYEKLASGDFDGKFKYRPYAAMEYSDYLMRNNGIAKALELMEKTIKSADTPPELMERAMFLKGEIQLKMGNNRNAMDAFETCMSKFPEGDYARWCRIYRIRITVEAKEYEKALVLLDEFRKKYGNDADSDTDYWQAYALMQCRRYNEALPFFLRIGMDSRSSDETRISGMYYAIYCMFMSGNYADAARHAGEFAATYPRTTLLGDVLLINSEALLKLKRTEEAEAACRKALGLHTDTPEKFGAALDLLVNILETAGKWQQAVDELLKKADIVKKETKADILIRAADCAVKAKDFAGASAIYEKAAASATTDRARFAAYSSILNLQLESKNYEAALGTTAKLKTCCPGEKMSDLLFNEANILYCAQKHDEAIAVLKEIITKYGNSADRRIRAQFMLVSMLLVAGKDKESVPFLDTLFAKPAAELENMENYQFLCMAGEAYSRMGMRAKARSAWKRIMSHADWPTEHLIDAKLRIAGEIIKERKYDEMQTAEKLLEKAKKEIESSSSTSGSVYAEVLSLYSEALMLQNKHEMAISMAEKAMGASNTSQKSGARAMYILANIALNVEKNAEKANRFATQCYILTNDADYCPMAMAISISAFRALGKTQQAAEVLKELSQKYPLWLAAHPELRKIK